ncbi:reverse transcriptase [Danaus plexippus plexippus]|uniref:Reverse transcriptase n=1 Tax=Danaus plexippus plexippus TaxID=278856 RepID=A0A212FN74_DANPL|nr:reverse transcriptase [Danaus plexippus plexippus]
MVSRPAGVVSTYALLDNGSKVTLVDSKIAQLTEAKGPEEPLHIEAIAETKITEAKSYRISLQV